MMFRLGKFTLFTELKYIKSTIPIIAPQAVKDGKPVQYKIEYKEREITIFANLYLETHAVIEDLFCLIEFTELLKAFSSNKLETGKDYTIESLTARIVKKNEKYSLTIATGQIFFHFSKFECMTIASQISKILQKCEAWQEQRQ